MNSPTRLQIASRWAWREDTKSCGNFLFLFFWGAKCRFDNENYAIVSCFSSFARFSCNHVDRDECASKRGGLLLIKSTRLISLWCWRQCTIIWHNASRISKLCTALRLCFFLTIQQFFILNDCCRFVGESHLFRAENICSPKNSNSFYPGIQSWGFSRSHKKS